MTPDSTFVHTFSAAEGVCCPNFKVTHYRGKTFFDTGLAA